MRSKWLPAICCLLLLLNSCRKENTTPIIKQPSKPVTNTLFLSINNVLQSNMVIQRGKPCKIWGTSNASAIITIKVSWNSTSLSATADDYGNWQANIPASTANATPQTITVTSGKISRILSNILIGDVWVCSGQSNMVYEMNAIPPFEGVVDYQTEIAAADYPQIRALTVQSDPEANPADSLTYIAQWGVCSPQTVGDMSGVAYYFARKLNTSLNVPIGIIVSAVDGTSCEAWLNNEGFQANPYLSKYSGINSSAAYYNGMINPLIKLSISGFIWYQGENNKNDNPVSDYTKLNSALIEAWRQVFN